MHICYISQEYPPETGWGGIGSYTYEMAHGLAKLGHQVTVVARAVKQECVTWDDKVTIYRVLPKPDWGRFKGMWRVNYIWPGFAWAAAKKIGEIHAESRIDLVETPECRADGSFLPLFRLKWREKPKHVVRLHTPSIFVHRWNHLRINGRKKFEYFLEKQAIFRSDAVTAPTKAVFELTASWASWGGKPNFVVPNPIDSGAFRPSERPRRKECLYVGRLEKHKGIATLMRTLPSILEEHPEATFRFVGKDGTDKRGVSWRCRILENLPINVRSRVFFEELSRSELLRAYREATLCVFPSLWENCPYVLLEAMACKTPSVVTKVGGFPELIDDGEDGLLVPPNDSDSLKYAVGRLLENPALAESMGAKAREKVVERFDVRRLAPEMLKIYQEILSEKK